MSNEIKKPDLEQSPLKRGKVLPPFLFLGGLIAITLLNRIPLGIPRIPTELRYLGIIPLIAGPALVFWCAVLFRRAGTPIKPFTESKALVTHGPYRISRNPIYAGMWLGLVGMCMTVGSALPWIVPIAFMIAISQRFIKPEEALLKTTFGDSYAAYCENTRRWI